MKYISVILFVLFSSAACYAQKMERNLVREGNRAFRDSSYVNAEIAYRKALEVNPQSSISMYNLGNTLLQQNKVQDAMMQYSDAANVEKDKSKLSQIYHNSGVILQSQKEYAKAVEAYKEALRNNPKDDETRYNLALAQKMLKDQQQQNQQNQNQNQPQNQPENQEQEKDKKEEQQQNKDNQQDQSQENKNEMSKENAEQLLKSVMQDEKDVQDKVKKQQILQSGSRLEKDW